MKHPQKPPKAFAALVIGMLGFTLASAYIFVSAAPTKISEQNSQPTISKIGLITSDAKGKSTDQSFVWTGKPALVKYSAAASKLQMFAQATNSSIKAPVWYAFDSFSLVSKVVTPATIEKMALADAPDANSSLWQKTRSATVSNLPLEKDEKRILVVYISNADPKSVMNKGIVDALAYIVVQDGTDELKGPIATPKTNINLKLSTNSPSGASSKGVDQVVARVVVYNANNPDKKFAQLQKIRISPQTNLKQYHAATRVMRLYRTDSLTPDNLLGTFEFNSKSCLLDAGCSAEFDLTAKALQSTIEAGTSLPLTVTLDTVDAIAFNEFKADFAVTSWTDGEIPSIIGDSKLSIKTGTLTY